MTLQAIERAIDERIKYLESKKYIYSEKQNLTEGWDNINKYRAKKEAAESELDKLYKMKRRQTE